MGRSERKVLKRLSIDKASISVSSIVVLSICILLYMLTCVTGFLNTIAQNSRFVILPLFIILAYISVKRIYFDTPTVLLFILAVTPSILFSDYFGNAAVKAATVLLLFIAVSMFFYSRRKTALQSFYYSLLILSYLAVIANTICYFLGQGRSGSNFRGYFGNRNALGAALVMCIVIFLAETWRTKNIIPFLFTAITAFLIIETHSRGAFYGMLIGILVFLFIVIKNKIVFAIVFGVVSTLVFVFWEQISNNYMISRILNEGVTRNELWDYAIKVINENFFVGVGFSSSEFSNKLAGNENVNFHNSYLAMMADVGIIGVLFFFGLFLYLFYKIYMNYKNSNEKDRVFYIALISLCIAFFGLSFGEAYLIVAGSPFSFTFWCCMFCLLHYNRDERYQNSTEKVSDKPDYPSIISKYA